METELIVRNTYPSTLSYVAQLDNVAHPEFVTLQLDHRRSPLDVGVLAYSVRQTRIRCRY